MTPRLDPAVRRVRAKLRPSSLPRGFRLTHIEATILAALADGLDDGSIAYLLNPADPASDSAVCSRIARLRARMDARNRAHMVALAIQWKILYG